MESFVRRASQFNETIEILRLRLICDDERGHIVGSLAFAAQWSATALASIAASRDCCVPLRNLAGGEDCGAAQTSSSDTGAACVRRADMIEVCPLFVSSISRQSRRGATANQIEFV